MNLSDLPGELVERGIWWQVGGFAIAGCASVAVLQLWEGSDFWAYRSFEIATKDLYWSFILPLAGLFEGVRRMFEKASAIRAAQREKMWRKAQEKGRKAGRKEALTEVRNRLNSAAEQLGQKDPVTGAITLTPEVLDSLFGEPAKSDA